VALITGATGQDGLYMTAHLLFRQTGWKVHAIVRKNSLYLPLLEHMRLSVDGKLHLHYGDITDAFFVLNLLSTVRPSHVYNFAAQSHVAHSFVTPVTTFDTNTHGLMTICESLIKLHL